MHINKTMNRTFRDDTQTVGLLPLISRLPARNERMYFRANEVVYVDKTGPHRYEVRNHSAVRVAECVQCGGYRFQTAICGGCHGPVRCIVRETGQECCLYGSCLHKLRYDDVAEFAFFARRYVARCAACGVFFVDHRERTSICMLCPEHKPPLSSMQRCEVCGQPCASTAEVATALDLHLYPRRIRVGAPHVLCPARCEQKFRREAQQQITQDARRYLRRMDEEMTLVYDPAMRQVLLNECK